ncbi:MAG: hypothetical protein D3924_03865 [Candidatus Electrothrix sp. AR4]|nr:hypothetical protein [Candidatus Electrothrix sp. AR4]
MFCLILSNGICSEIEDDIMECELDEEVELQAIINKERKKQLTLDKNQPHKIMNKAESKVADKVANEAEKKED